MIRLLQAAPFIGVFGLENSDILAHFVCSAPQILRPLGALDVVTHEEDAEALDAQ